MRLVLVHGFTQTGRSWDPIATRLRAEGHEVVAPDAPGHGSSDALRGDLWAAADHLVAVGGRATYVGYSMGGRMCLHAALAHPRSVERLVLVSATAGLETEAERSSRRAADETLAAELERDGLLPFLDRWLSTPLLATLPRPAAGLDDRLTNTVEGLASSLRTAGTGTQDPLWSRLDDLAMPTLVVSGARDQKFTELARRLRRNISDSHLVVVPDAGHTVHLEQPEAFLDALLRFLSSSPARR